MKSSGYRSILHIYLIFFLSLLGTILAAIGLFMLLITVQKPDGTKVRSDWPKSFTESFKDQIFFIGSTPQIKQTGLQQLQDNDIGLQILDSSGSQIYAFQEPEAASTHYSMTDLLALNQTGGLGDESRTTFLGTITTEEGDHAYLLHFPMDIQKTTMYLSGLGFKSGKTLILGILGILLLVILTTGLVYGFWTAKIIGRLAASIKDISTRSYLPLPKAGAFGDLYGSLNTLDTEIRASDALQKETDTLRREWLANITHDLKTPLSPIKGYAEILQDASPKTDAQCRHYAAIMLKNATHMENLINDLKLTYQLEKSMVPINRQQQNLVRFLRELVIDMLNRPEYINRSIHFESAEAVILFSFDEKLLTRAFQNLIINAFVHGQEDTEITLQVALSHEKIQITHSDNGKGMTEEEVKGIFERYYRGTDTESKPEGTGLGLAIAKNIVELHGGSISLSSLPNLGTRFYICFLGS